MQNKWFGSTLVTIVSIGVLGVTWSPTSALDHSDAPNASQDRPGDLADAYVFQDVRSGSQLAAEISLYENLDRRVIGSPISYKGDQVFDAKALQLGANPKSGQSFNRVILAMTAHPWSVAGEAPVFNFDERVQYDLNIDYEPADQVADEIIRVTFDPAEFNPDNALFQNQSYTLSFIRPSSTIHVTNLVVSPPQISPGGPTTVSSFHASPLGGLVRSFAGPRDDPNFADVISLLRTLTDPSDPNGLPGTGIDRFAGFNVQAVVLELPPQFFEKRQFQFWVTADRGLATLRSPRITPYDVVQNPAPLPFLTDFGGQVDRMANPMEVAPLDNFGFTPSPLPSPAQPFGQYGTSRDAFNASSPSDDLTTNPVDYCASLPPTALATYCPGTMKVDLDQPMGFPNGRTLTDDAFDLALAMLAPGLSQPVDLVSANDVPALSVMPFLAPPHVAP